MVSFADDVPAESLFRSALIACQPHESWPLSRLIDRIEQSVAHASRSGDAVAVVALRTAAAVTSPGVLDELARSLTQRLRSSDTALALEPGTVVVLLTGLRNAEDSASVVQELLGVVEAAADELREPGLVPVRAGIAVFPWDADAPGGLLQHALSVVPSTASPRSSYHFASPLLQSRARRHQQIAHGLRHAAARGEFSLAYQPQVDPAREGISGAEALLRWSNPHVGAIGPADFISIAEQNGTIVPIGQWVLESALQQLADWDQRGTGPREISVNVSPFQIAPRNGPGLTEVVERALQSSGIDAHRLELEITESNGILDDAFAIAELEAVARMGVGFAVDDFGKGYTSITYLRRLPLKRLKIDREYIDGLPWNTQDFVLVESLIHLAKSFGLEVVAEGVTTQEQVATLRGFGCTTMQGFLFGKPLSAVALEALIHSGGDWLVKESYTGADPGELAA
jgi:EAL domain-containing protein (putative c-di-GMP-specific phosphodiesterase class I)